MTRTAQLFLRTAVARLVAGVALGAARLVVASRALLLG